MFCRLLSISFLIFSSFARAELDEREALVIVESLLSSQNPLLVLREISYDEVSLSQTSAGFIAQVLNPRLPARPAILPSLTIDLRERDSDLTEVRITDIQTTSEMLDGAILSFRPIVFSGLYSRANNGFEMLQFGLADLTYQHPSGQFLIKDLNMSLTRKNGFPTLDLIVNGFSADMQDVADFKESIDNFTLSLRLSNSEANGGDLLVLTNKLFAGLVDSGQEGKNAIGKDRSPPQDLSGLDLELTLSNLSTRWMALRDQGPRETIAHTTLEQAVVQGNVSLDSDGYQSMFFSIEADGISIDSPDAKFLARVDGGVFDFQIEGLTKNDTAGLLFAKDRSQPALLGQLFGNLRAISINGGISNFRVESADEPGFFELAEAGASLTILSPFVMTPNSKNVELIVNIGSMGVDYPLLTQAYEPAWSNLFSPGLPQELGMVVSITALPSEVWVGLASLFFDTSGFPIDLADAPVLSLSLDGTHYESDLVNAQLGGILTFSPGASLLATGDLNLTIDDLRGLIVAMQRSARVPERNLAQLLTLGSVGLATIASFAERDEEGREFFSFGFQQDGFPTINGRPLPIGF